MPRRVRRSHNHLKRSGLRVDLCAIARYGGRAANNQGITTMSMKKKLFAAAAAAALITAVSAGTAFADGFSNNSTPGFTITGGTGPRFDTAVAGGTTFPTVGNFNSVTMNGTPQLTSASIAPFTVIDDSGTGTGWSVTLLVPDFTDVGGDVVAAAGAQMNKPVVASG